MQNNDDYIKGRLIEKERTLDEIWEWMEVEVECEKPNPVLNQLCKKIIKMRTDRLVIEFPGMKYPKED